MRAASLDATSSAREDADADADAIVDDDRATRTSIERDAYERSPCETTCALTLAVVWNALRLGASALALGVSVAMALTPRWVKRLAREGAFACGYGVYASWVGRWAHARMIARGRDDGAHSKTGAPTVVGGAVVVQVPFLSDNYSYVVVDAETREACAIDPADPEAAAEAARRCGARVTTVLTTHKHHDHAGGNGRLRAMMRERENGSVEVNVYGHARDRCHGVNVEVRHGDVIRVGAGTRFLVTHVPCHTLGHVVYALLGDESADGEKGPTLANAKAAFTGDAIINGGVGAFFHGDAKDCYENIHSRLAEAPDDCLIFSGHEYMETNMRVAKAIDPDDLVTANCFFAIRLHRHQEFSTMPSSFRVERRLNPYFRCGDRDYLKTLLASKRMFDGEKLRPWWHRCFGPSRRALEAERDRQVESCALAKLLRANDATNATRVASAEEAIAGIDLVRDLMSEVFSTMDVRNGDEEEQREFREYVRLARATGTLRVVISQLVSDGV